MPFFKKKELPLAPPDNGFPNWEGFSENAEAVKQEMAVRNSTQMPELPELPEEGMPELPELPSPKSSRHFEIEIPEAPEEITHPAGSKIKLQHEEKMPRPLFIKVDKFKEILDSIETIDRKLREIKNAMQKLREIQAKEAETMELWETEVQELKAKLDVIEKTLSRVEK